MPDFWVPTGVGRSEYIEKKSRFIGKAGKAASVEEVREIVRALRVKHPRSRHVVWAYILGSDAALKGLSDDGEPHGTAGRPVLDPIEGNRLTFTLVTVVRYFGGVKLGTGGLVSAYSRTCREALKALPRERLIDRSPVALGVEYSHYESVRKLADTFDCRVINEDFGGSVKIELEVPTGILEEFRRAVIDVSRGAADFIKL